ncbi:IcmT/TraK family protein [Cupriavidus pauculus]|uniref:IcmT/TraK family protein n=1 Tax=Burkholderiaceae TaxID=119060 RepID=UPI0004938206|nr:MULTISPECIES: IcmT/TraK family protein [Burkholderiaceae]MCM3609246.1 IcmT/TraK family protein [Cupriavidus pauculus]
MSRNVWRDTSRTERFFVFDAKAGIPFFFFLAHIAWWTFALAVVSFVVFGVLERLGISLKVALRLLRSWIAGPIRYAVAWWHKPQKRL